MAPKAEVEQRKGLLSALFLRLRGSGFPLGVSELLDALRVVEGGWGHGDFDDLKRLAALLWCKGWQDRRELDAVWEAVALAEGGEETPSQTSAQDAQASTKETSRTYRQDVATTVASATVDRSREDVWRVLPVQAPQTSAAERGDEFATDWPLTRRSMTYHWRFLRRPLADGPADVLDVPATVESTARRGFFLAPVYRRRERNHAHLALLLDQGGSMVPFHRFTRDLAETAREESDIEEVEVCYFLNVAAGQVYSEPHFSHPLELERLLEPWGPETSVLVVSDAGSARGGRNLDRIFATAEFLAALRRRTPRLAWLNPMPAERWAGSSAQWIAPLVPMFEMDPDGLSNAIDVLRGQPLGQLA